MSGLRSISENEDESCICADFSVVGGGVPEVWAELDLVAV